jgi:hypothetical protein
LTNGGKSFLPPQKTTIPLDDELLKLWNQLAKETLRMNETNDELTDIACASFVYLYSACMKLPAWEKL